MALGKVIIVAGTPGTGKTTVARAISEKCGLRIINLSELAMEKGYITAYDESRSTYIIDEDKLVNDILNLAKSSEEHVLVQTHYPEIIPRDIVDRVFILRTHPLILEKRLLERGWSRRKINENVMAEILGVVASNAVNAFGSELIYEIDTSSTKPEDVAELICLAVNGLVKLEPGVKIDWLTMLSPEEVFKFEDYLGGEE
ncbi:MAG: adenylate kinase family protein [Desulfurococcaceae archaeon]